MGDLMADIVTRLRGSVDDEALMHEAADLIESLLAALKAIVKDETIYRLVANEPGLSMDEFVRRARMFAAGCDAVNKAEQQ
jgi:hypothetical protein